MIGFSALDRLALEVGGSPWAGLLLAQLPAGGGADAPPTPPDTFRPVILFMLVMAFMAYFMFLRPQSQERKKHEGMLNEVKKGDEIITLGGIHGKVTGVDAQKGTMSVEIAPKTTVKINKSALSSVTPKGGKAKDDAKAGSARK